ncbi:flavodoxin [Peptostreptococcus russellii]|uniref:Flavodoxin n=1 Tax=Peptostreptococcus russellii TaxID=215200 RepID=A0A2P7Q2G6_9FIRM|nr:flavodoxin domain-containing protein [Peptostreptococcus russellii]PSJ32163.1 flavodoxin [Peptostreptococcus russellii]
MKTLIICYSYYKNHTEKIARVFKDRIGCNLIKLDGKNDLDIDIEDYDLIGFGSGIYAESISPKIFLLIDKLNLKGKNVFVFSTSGIGKKFYNKSLIKVLKSKGAIVRGSFACMGSFVTKDFSNFKLFDLFAFFARNHPNKKDFKDAEKFIDRVIDF